MSQPPSTITRPAKKALSIAICYSRFRESRYAKYELPGVHGDSDTIVSLLTGTFGYSEDEITVLKDSVDGSEPSNAESNPTQTNILRAMKDLVSDAQEGDHRVFHISGHGFQRLCETGLEQDGLDELFWPVDVEPHKTDTDADNIILDDTIKQILVDGLRPGVNLVIIADCCHSGTIADLDLPPNHAVRNQGIRVNAKSDQDSTSMPHVVCWSACRDGDNAYNPDGSKGIFTRVLSDTIGNPENASKTHTEVFNQVNERMGKIMDIMHVPSRPQLSTLDPQTKELTISTSFGEREAAA